MKYFSFFLVLSIFTLGIKCSNHSHLKDTPEQIAIEYFSDSVVQNKSVFDDTSAIVRHDWPEFDSMWILKGFLYKEVLFASALVSGISEPKITRESLRGKVIELMDSSFLERTNEYIRNFEAKLKSSPADFNIRIPKKFPRLTNDEFALRKGTDEFLVIVRHHIKSSDQIMVEICLMGHHGEMHSFLIFFDLDLRINGWMNRGRLVTDFTRDIYDNVYIPR